MQPETRGGHTIMATNASCLSFTKAVRFPLSEKYATAPLTWFGAAISMDTNIAFCCGVERALLFGPCSRAEEESALEPTIRCRIGTHAGNTAPARELQRKRTPPLILDVPRAK